MYHKEININPVYIRLAGTILNDILACPYIAKMKDLLYQYLCRFIDLSQEELFYIEQFAELRHFEKKVRLINIGEPEVYTNFVVKGVLKKFFYNSRREEIITQIAREGDLISSSVAFLSSSPSDYAIETFEPVSVISFSRDNIERIYGSNYKMERLGRLVITDWFLQKEHWEYNRIKLTPKQRFLAFVSNNPDLLLRVPQKSLASYLNIKPETFSRYKHLLVQKPSLSHLHKNTSVAQH